MKQARFALFCSIAVILAFAGLTYSKDFDDAIKDANRAFTDAVGRHDSIAIGGIYHKDAIAFPPNHEVVKGRDDIQELWRGILSPSVAGIELKTEDREKEDDLGVEWGTYEIKGEQNATLDKGKYVVVWKKEHGDWRIYRDIWNSSLPAPTAAPVQ